MNYYAGIDVSLELSSVCVVDATGKIRREIKVPSEPEALVQFSQQLEPAPVRIGLEAGPLSQWLYAGLVRVGFDVVLLETRHVKAALSAMLVKTDRKDARGIAQMVRMGWYRPVHCKTLAAQEIRALLVAREQRQAKLLDLELCIRGIVRGFGLKLGVVPRSGFETRFSALKRWAVEVARRRGLRRAKVALARKLATDLHRIWVDGTTFRWSREAVMTA